jgi:hypothetical protein
MSDERHNPGREPDHGPRHEPGRERFEDLKEAYALGALSEEERREIEDYLGMHPELRADVYGLKSLANLRSFVFWGCDSGVVIQVMPRPVSWENDLLLTMTKKAVST